MQFHDNPNSEFLRVDIIVSWRYTIYILGLFLVLAFTTYITSTAIVRFVYSFSDYYDCFSYCHSSPLW